MLLNLINRIKKLLSPREDLRKCKLQKDIRFLNELKEPSNDRERSYCQYLCQMNNIGILKRMFVNFVSLVLYFPFLFALLAMSNMKSHNQQKKSIFWNKLGKNIIPISIQKKYNPFKITDREIGFLLAEDIFYLISIMKNIGFHPYFHLKTLLRISYYRKIIMKYHPDVIIATCEYSFTSSVLTEYCEKKKVKHINIMHGEKLWDIHDSFFRFSKCYVWDDFYVELFKSLKAFPTQFRIELPPSMKIVGEIGKTIDYKFYLDSLSKRELKRIALYCDLIKKSGYSVMVRPHPNSSNIKKLKRYIDISMIEDNKIGIDTSILTTKSIIAKCSTVINQAYYAGKEIIIDDITDKKLFSILKERNYIGFKLEHKLLSVVLDNLKNKGEV